MIVAVPIGLIIYTMYEEGAFDTTKNSILILVAGINRFRKLKDEDLEAVVEMHSREEELGRELERQGAAERARQEQIRRQKREQKQKKS